MRSKLIGITGGIASGKSTFSELIQQEGYTVIHSDQIGHEVLDYPEIKNKLISVFGKVIIKDHHIDRNVLRKIIFNDETKRNLLNSIVHPEILKVMDEMVDHSSIEYLFFEIPLLFESGMKDCFDMIVLIHVNHNIQIDRLINRNSFDMDEAEKIIRSQMPDELKIPLADLTVDNSYSESVLQNNCWNLIKYLPRITYKHITRFSEINGRDEKI